MWYHANPATPEEKKTAIAAYKAAKKAEHLKDKQDDEEKEKALKALSPEEKAFLKSENARRSKEAAAKKAAEKKALKEEKARARQERAALSPEARKDYDLKKKAEHREKVKTEFAAYKEKHALLVSQKGEALAKRYDFGGKIHRFFFNLGQTRFCQGYMNWWRKLEISNPVLAGWIYQIFYFIVFSEGVTIYQYLILVFLPMAFGLGLAGTPFMWPQLVIGSYTDPSTQVVETLYWNILGYDIVKNKAGEVIIGGGLGYFLAFEIATFTSQIINFPLQRNITFKSHGNIPWQIMWYFIGWVAISLLCNMVNGLWIPFASHYLPSGIYNLLVMFVTGGISMVVFFFIFKIIFPTGGGDTSIDPREVKMLMANNKTAA